MESKHALPNPGLAWAKFIICSVIGVFMFFVNIQLTIGGVTRNTIPVDHLHHFVRWLVGPMPTGRQQIIALLIMLIGAVYPFIKKTWNQNTIQTVFTGFKILGVAAGAMHVLNVLGVVRIGPDFLHQGNFLPFLFNALCVSLAFLIPIGAVFLFFLINYGLMEFFGVFLRPIMRKVFRTPGRSAVDAVTSLVGNYALAMMITDKLLQEGKYTKREAAIIVTGFSTVSATFMVVVAGSLGLMDRWVFFFWTTMLVAAAVTAITARIFPLCKIPNEYFEGVTPQPEEPIETERFKVAIREGLRVASNSGNVGVNLWNSFKAGCRIVSILLPTIMSIGLLGMIIAEFTPVFNIIGFIFLPFTWLVRLPEALLAAQALSTGIVEMFLPAAFMDAELHSLQSRYVVAVSSITAVIFFSAVVPSILATKVPVKVWQMVIIWVERLILSILLSGLIALIFLR
ncbi:MAG: YjiH family protein [Treponema sp.]|jgi:nucleoside recognition membrane protein YjiH|nr:YjiH family protein [Treponema sp.]